MIPIKDNIQKFSTDPILEDQIRIYETKKSILDSAFLSEVAVNHLKKARGNLAET